MWIYVVVVSSVLFSACGNSDCERMYDKMVSVNKESSAKVDKATFVKQCNARMANASEDDRRVMKCMLDAVSAEAMQICATGGEQMQVLEKAKKSEAELELVKIGKAAKVAFAEADAFPIGKSTLPTAPCCAGPIRKCPVTTAWTTDPVWSKLDFQIDVPSLFQYSYESTDGKSATVTAVGDLACDGTPTRYTLKLGIEGGVPVGTIDKPAVARD